MILGHRGSPAELPENTLAGFVRAMSAGADGVELDVRITADGVPVIIHDETVDRTTDGTGRVADLTWLEMAELRVRPVGSVSIHANDPVPEPTVAEPVRIPTLDTVLRWAADTGAFLNLEIKCAGPEAAALKAVRSVHQLERVIFSSFIPAVVAEIGRIEPAARRYLLTEFWDAAAQDDLRACGAQGVCLEGGAATSDALAELAREGLPAIVWTVDDPRRIRRLLDAGVQAVITNQPAVGVAARAG